MALQAIRYSPGNLQLLDQRLLPFESTYLTVPDVQAAWTHIRDMVVRGAPAIGCTGALALAVDISNNKGGGAAFADAKEALAWISSTLVYLVTSRPTAVNLADAANRLNAAAAKAATAESATGVSVAAAVVKEAEAYFEDDILCNKSIGKFGAAALLAAAKARGLGAPGSGKLRVLTHCNTGSLATAGYGTALGVIRALHEQGQLEHAYCTETRPYNQGARLTAFELVHDGLPATLLVDSAAAALMGHGTVDAVVVGADRVVANGDTANKIGTYSLSIIAAHHNIPFFVAAPTTTLDANLDSGTDIEIEQRSPTEITHFRVTTPVAAENIEVWNPAFDVAPASLIHGIITEKGLVPKVSNAFQVRQFMSDHGLWKAAASNTASHNAAANGTTTASSQNGASSTMQNGTTTQKGTAAANGTSEKVSVSHPAGTIPDGFRALDTDSICAYIAEVPCLAAKVGPADTRASWKIREVGDGNINFVYIVEGPAGSLCVKQALPFVRCVGESWQLSQDRVRIEAHGLILEGALCPQHVPAVYHFDPSMCIIAMQYLPPPFIILRRGLIQGFIYPHFTQHVSEFMANVLFGTSLFKLDSNTVRQRSIEYNNPEMCALTELVIFTEPYMTAPNNHWTSPQLDEDAAALTRDVAAKVAAARLKQLFCGKAQALLHGDMHTGSIMVTKEETYVIDCEFAFYGPIAFDVAKIMAETLIAYFASFGHEAVGEGSRTEQQAWLLQTFNQIWVLFKARFLQLWSEQHASGALSPPEVFGTAAPEGPAALAAQQAAFMEELAEEVKRFAGAHIIRRIVGIAHAADLETISDADVRARCERCALGFGRHLLVDSVADASFEQLAAEAAAAATQLFR